MLGICLGFRVAWNALNLLGILGLLGMLRICLEFGAAWNAWSIGATNWVITAANLDALEEKSQTAIGYIEYVGTTVPSGNPATGDMILLGVVAIMILYQIWASKK